MVRIARGLWDQWGPRMQSILEQTVKTLHEVNEHPDTADDEQMTILDALTLLADEEFKNGVLTRVSDPYLIQWWRRDFKGWRGETKADALAPVQTRLSYYASSKRARAILGQPRSHHRPAPGYPRRRHPAGVHRPGQRGQGTCPPWWARRSSTWWTP